MIERKIQPNKPQQKKTVCISLSPKFAIKIQPTDPSRRKQNVYMYFFYLLDLHHVARDDIMPLSF